LAGRFVRQCGKLVERESPDVVADALLKLPDGTRLLIGFDYPIVKLRMAADAAESREARDEEGAEEANGNGAPELPLEPRADAPGAGDGDPLAETLEVSEAPRVRASC
jgi:hypothetical protein